MRGIFFGADLPASGMGDMEIATFILAGTVAIIFIAIKVFAWWASKRPRR